MKILMCNIFRDVQYHLPNYIDVMNELTKEHDVCISIYENDSIDLTRTLDNQYFLDRIPKLKDCIFVSEKLGDEKYGSVALEARVKNLAKYRNSAIDNAINSFKDDFDYLIFWDIDVHVDKKTASQFINSLDESHDISSITGIHTKPLRIADAWAVRKTKDCINANLINENSNDILHKVHDVWSTYNWYCAYRYDMIKEGIRFGWFNDRLNTWDCDTVVICEQAREAGYSNIVMNGNFIVEVKA